MPTSLTARCAATLSTLSDRELFVGMAVYVGLMLAAFGPILHSVA